jgi:hydroxypyruvate reductase
MPDWTDETARAALRAMFEAAVSAADPSRVLARHLPERPRGRVVVVGAGKAAASMAAAVEAAWPDVALDGVVVCPYGAAVPTRRIKVLEARHPVPDANSEAAAAAILAAVQGLSADDLVLALISGGGSALMALPAEGLTLEDKQAVNRALLASGLDIRTMNRVRKRLSRVKGGKLLAAAAPARVVTLGISDIPGDDPAAIASGPTIPDPDAGLDLGPLVERLGDALPEAARRILLQPAEPAANAAVDFRMIATPAMALEAAAAVARSYGLEPVMLGDAIEGEASGVGADMALRARLSPRGKALLSGGETTVTLGGTKPGKGGRNTEFLLALALGLDGAAKVWAAAADTDGEDGASGGAAGALIGPDSLARARAAGLDPAQHLAAHDSGALFAALGDLIVTGPTRTNVNDFRAILIG